MKPDIPFQSVDHVQLAMPRGQEETGRRFYVSLLGMTELRKPPTLSPAGAWFRSGTVQLHLGVEDDFRPARKAHPGLVCADYDGLLARLKAAGIAVRDDTTIPGTRRCYVDDPFGNRLELIAP